MTFYGYRRPDGRVGVRNKVLILPTSVCASDTARIISQQVEGSVTFNNQQGCSQVAVDQQLTMDVMAGYAANPNIYGTVLVSLGCENCQMDLVAEAIAERTNKPMQRVIIQEAGGTLKAVEQAVRYAKQMARGIPDFRTDRRHGVRRLGPDERSGGQPGHRRDERPRRCGGRHEHPLRDLGIHRRGAHSGPPRSRQART